MAIKLSGIASGMDTESMVKELMKAQSLKKTKIQNKITKTEWKQDKWKALNTKIYSFYTGSLAKLKMQGNFNTKAASSSDETKVTVSAGSTAPEGTHTLKIQQLASAQFVTGAKLGAGVTTSTKLTDLGMAADVANQITVATGSTTKTLTISNTSTIADVTKVFQDAGLNASFDQTQKRFFISSKESGYQDAFSISTSGAVDLTKLGLNTITKTDNGDGTVTVVGGGSMTLIAPIDAKYEYNGVAMTSSSNSVSVNGLSLTLKGVTDGAGTPDPLDDKVISLGVKSDTDAVYNMVKDFVKKYNELIAEMNEDYHAVSAKGYEPLTDDQKESMTDDQISKWETKIQDSLLRRDDMLGSLLNTMRTKLAATVTIDSKSYSMSTFGVVTGNYTEKGLLHINGDEEDSKVAGLDNGLKKALIEDPDKVMKVFTELADNLYTTLTDNMKSTSLRSALTVYNDKEMTKSLTNYKNDLTKMEEKLQDIEDRYYKQFSAMESAMSKLNSQSSSLASILGMSSGS